MSWSYLRFTLAASAACLRLLARRELDVVHVHNIPDFLVFAGLLPRLAGTKVVLDVHDSVPETFATKFSAGSAFWKALCLEERLSALVAHRVICVNHPQRDTLVARGIPASKTFVSMNVPDPLIFRTVAGRRPAESRGRHFNLVYHGTMAERLGVDLIIRAVAQLHGRVPGSAAASVGPRRRSGGVSAPGSGAERGRCGLVSPEGLSARRAAARLGSMDLGVVGNRRSAACDLMLPVKLVEYVSLGIPAVVPRLKTIEHYFSDDMVSLLRTGRCDIAGRCHLPAVPRAGDARQTAGRRVRASFSANTAGSGRARNS